MLVLRRRCYETIMVGDDIAITVIAIDGDGVRLGITALPEVPVHRKETWDAIQLNDLEAAWGYVESPPILDEHSLPARPA